RREARRLEVEARFLELLAVAVAGEKGELAWRLSAREGRFAHFFPAPRIESRQALEAEPARVPRRDRERHHGRLDRERAAAAHGIEERLAAVPTGQPHAAAAELLLHQRLTRDLPE